MPLEAHVTRVRDAIRAFLLASDPDHRVLVVRTAPELVPHAARLVKSLERHSNRLFTAQPGEGHDAASCFQAWEADLREQFERARRSWKELSTPRGDALASLDVPLVDTALPLVTRYVSWFERLARAVAPFRAGLVLVAFVDDDLEADTVLALRAFGAELASRRVRLVVVDARQSAVFVRSTRRVSRVRVGSLLPIAHDPRSTLAEFLASPTERVMVAEGGRNLPHLLRPNDDRIEFEFIRLPYEGGDALDRSLSRTLARARQQAERALVVLALDLQPNPQPERAAHWVRRFARECADPRLKVVVVDDANGSLGAHVVAASASHARCAARGIRFSLSAAEMARGADEKLKLPGLPPRERFALLLLRSGFASGSGRFDEALRDAKEAKDAAPATNDPTHPPMAALSIANTLYRAGRFAEIPTVLEPEIDAACSPSTDAPGATRLIAPMVSVLAATRLRLGELEDAAELYAVAAEAEQANGTLPVALHHELWRGEALRRLGQIDDARAVWLRVVDDCAAIGAELADARAEVEAEANERLARLAEGTGDGATARSFHARAHACCPHPHAAHEP